MLRIFHVDHMGAINTKEGRVTMSHSKDLERGLQTKPGSGQVS